MVAAFGPVSALDKMYLPKGCEQCEFTGYSGRAGIYEVMVIGDALRRAIRAGESSEGIRAIAIQNGFRPMQQDAAGKIASGQTSLEEVMRNVPCEVSLAEVGNSYSHVLVPPNPPDFGGIAPPVPVFQVGDYRIAHSGHRVGARAHARRNS